uniref:DNA-dependent protein kinase catalytic subunit n=1 Tax=Anopheles dirus TaxID=7168 RepID=A0A182N6I2_9DIPT
MAADLSSCLRQLKICLDTQQVPQARNIVARITQLIVEKADETEAECDFNLECVFTSPNGVVAFLEKSFPNAKLFAKPIEDAFELFRKTIEKHSSLLGKRMNAIVPIALRYIQSSAVPARHRELATLVLQDSIAYGCLHRDTYEQLAELPNELLMVFQQSKITNRFQQNLFELLGQLAKQFPWCLTEPDRVRDVFLSAAENQLLEENYPSLVSLAGAVRGLDLYLVHFAPSEDEYELRRRLYVLVKKLSPWDEGRSERSLFRNALQLVANHAPLFTLPLYEDHVHWQTMLAGKWIKSSNRDERQVGLAALYAFHGEVARVLCTPALLTQSERACPPTVDVLNQYLSYYRKLLNSPTADRWDIRIAIRGFGIMAGACQQLTGSSATLSELLTIVLERIEGICGRSETSTTDMLEFLPDFIQSLSEILTHAKELSTVQLVSMQTMTVALVRDFYHLATVHHDLIVRSLVRMLDNVGKLGGTIRDQLLDNVLLQGVIWSCTHSLPFAPSTPEIVSSADSTPRKVDWKRELVTYRNYLPLWQGLLAKAQSETDDSLLRSLYRAFMNTLFVIVEKLDLSTRKRTFQDDDGQQRELFFCDPNIDQLPNKPKDYHIFLNLVELYRDVLHGHQTPTPVRELFSDWFRPFFERFVRQSLNRPLVSGFVKLIEMGLGTAERIGYFHQNATVSGDPEVLSTLLLVMFYLEQTIHRALHAVGELQLACLRFVLNAPVLVLLDFIEDDTRKQPLMLEVFRISFHLGRSLLSIARSALYCLQRLIRFRQPPIPATVRERLLRQVLPMLEPFLRTRDSTQPPAQSLRLAKFKRHRTANVAAEKIERIKQQHRIDRAADACELVTFQKRILNFFADLQPNECCWLVVDELELAGGQLREEPEAASLTRWDADSGRSLELRLLCESGTRPCIKLDAVVGRVCELAVECSDRATKLAACELLHTIVLYLLGINYQDQLSGLWSQLCRHLLQLSCDTDLAVCQMFEPLLFQIIHYVTQPSKLNQQGTKALLASLLDATCNVQNSAIRDLAVRCSREFLQWTNRQSGGSSQSNNERRRIKCTVLDLLKTHALESNASRRYGSALAFNNLYRLLLQEDFHIERYCFELMHSYAIGLAVTEEQNGFASEASGNGDGAVVEQFLLVLGHIGKLFEERKAMFNLQAERSEHRQIVPPEIGGGTMEHLVRWLFRQCAARQRLYRRKCMQLFPRLSRTVHNVSSGEDFLEKHFTREQIEGICLQVGTVQGIDRAPTLASLRVEQAADGSLVTDIYLWLEYFLATLDMHCWLQREGLVDNELTQALRCRILPAVLYFLRSVVSLSVYEIMAHIKPDESHETHSRMNAEKIVKFDTLKAAVVVQIVDLLVMLVSSEEQAVLALWQEEATIEFVLSLLFKPHKLGLDCNIPVHRELEDDRPFWKQLDTLLLQLIGPANHSVGQRFASALTEILIQVMEQLGDRMKMLLTQRTIAVDAQRSAKGLLFVAKQLRKQDADTTLVMPATKARIGQTAGKLLDDCYEAIAQEGVRFVLSPSAARFGSIVLQAIFTLPYAVEPGVEGELLTSTLAHCLNVDPLQPNIRHGEHFLICFGPAVYELFFTNPSECFNVLSRALTEHNFTSIVRMLCDMIDYSYRVHASDTEPLRRVTKILLSGWAKLFECSRLQPNRFGVCDLQMMELMSNVAMICPFPLNEIRVKAGPTYERWLAELIGSSQVSTQVSIGLKTKAIVLLPTVLGSDATTEQESCYETALEQLQTLHFPLRSSEFPPNSPERIGFQNCLERLLDALVVSRSPLLLKAIVQMTAPEGEGHIAEVQIRHAIERFFADQPLEAQCDRLKDLWELFNNHEYAPTVRTTILRRYLCPGLWHCRYDTVVEFYRRTIRSISSFTAVEINGRSGWDLEHALVDRAASFRLMEHYAALLPKTTLMQENCLVAQELYGPALDSSAFVRGQRLIGDFSKRAHGVRRVAFRAENRTAAELFRKYQCAAYRALVALISNTNDDSRMYSVLLFRENREKGEFLWRHLIDCSDDDLYLEAGQDQEQTPRTMEKRVAIRRETGDSALRPLAYKDPGHSVVVESSLSQQVSRYDLNNSVILSARELAQRDAAELMKRQKGALSHIPLERTRINEHEIMATVCGCVRHMVAAKVALDAVVQFLVASMADSGQRKNVRLFLAKVVDNCRSELKPHSAVLLGPLMQLIVDERIFRGLNPLVTDLIALVLEWNAEPRRTPRVGSADENGSLASVLLRFLMRHTCKQEGTLGSARQQAFRLNLELIKELIAQWHDTLIVPAELLFEMISTRQSAQVEERAQFELTAGLQLGTCVLVNGRGKLVPWMESTRLEYLRAVLRCLDAANSSIFKPAAQLLGHSLAHLYPCGFPEDDQQQQDDGEHFHTECIAKFSHLQRAQGRKCVELLYETAKAFPSIADSFLSIISFRIPGATGAEKRMCLELLLGGRLEKFGDELFRELASMELALLLRDGDLQLPTLHLLNRSLPLVGELQQLQQLIEPVGWVATEATTQLESRAVAYEILIYIHDSREAELTDESKKTVWRYLMHGLCTADEADTAMASIRARILEYLTDTGRLPGDLKERFLYLLTELYEPTVEADFLGTAVALLLDPAVRCREAKDRLFLHEYLNADVKFSEYTIETGARKRHTMTLLTPMFAESSTQRQLQTFIGRGSQMEQMIRATQFAGAAHPTLEGSRSAFEPTEDPARFIKGRETFAMPTQHSLLFESGSLLQLDRRSQRTAGNVIIPPELSSQERTFERLRKRILKDSETSRERQTAWAVSRHYSSRRQQAEQRRESSSKVTLYRRYRLADYPDLQINLLAFLLPLQALCRRDKACARQTFVAIFNGLVENLTASDTENRSVRMAEWDRFVERLDQSVHRILEATKACDPNLFGGLVELTLGPASGKFTLSPRTVASVAGTSNMLTMGVLYLEAKLAHGDDFDGVPVRAGPGRATSSEAEHWLQLSTLYHTLHEHSVVVGIFGEKQDSDPGLRDAIELEALGRYDRAHRAYCELISRISPARVEERNFCYRSAYNCLLQLGQWDVLLEEIGSQATNHEELWSDEWNQENLLPSYMHGNVRLNLAGDESGRTFCRILEEWMHIPARAEHIRQHFGEELTALQIACGEMVRARLYGEQMQRQFLEEWHCAGVLSELVRMECLVGVRKVVELTAYSELLELESSSDRLEQAAEGLVHSWRHAQPLVTDSLGTWDTIIAYRRFLLTKLETKCSAQSVPLSELSALLLELELHLLEVAFEQNNIKYAGKLITRLRYDEASSGAQEPRLEQVLRRKIARVRYDRTRQVMTSSNVSSTLIGGFRRLAQLHSHITTTLVDEPGLQKVRQKAWTELFQYAENVRQLVGASGEGIRPEESSAVVEIIRTTIGQAHGGISEHPEGLRETMRQFALQCLQQTIDAILTDQSGSSDNGDRKTAALELAQAHLRLARYCYDELDAERDEAEELPMERLLVTSLLAAISHGSQEARHMFPVLLQLRNLQNNALQKEFQELSCTVPSWNFLPWIPQLLSHMKTTTDASQEDFDGHFLDELLMRLVREYPMALYFPARLVLGGADQPLRPFMVRLSNALSCPVLDRFVQELFRVVMPASRLHDMLVKLKSRLDALTDRREYETFIDRAVSSVFPAGTDELWRYGQAYRAAMPVAEKIRSLKSLHPRNDRDALLKKLLELEADIQSLRAPEKKHHIQLEDLSPWLADYHSSGQCQRGTTAVEVPGQYTLDRGQPNPAQHVTIVKVMPDLVVYGTLRLPVLMSFRGSDGRQHRFLAKFGEDLRQDQRIQQLQREITHRLRWDRRCREQRLELRTYEVVPISPDFGLFGWLEGTVALAEIAVQASPRYNPGYRGQAYVQEEYVRFLLSVLSQEPAADASFNVAAYNTPSLYGMAIAHCIPDRLESKFVELAQTIRENTLQRALYDMAASPESFYRLRMNFAKSLATMNVTCWALGIGDRHLSNIVLERATGRLVGVDFGIAFGAGTRDLPVPELVPFRLTPQFVGVMDPMRLPGVLQKCHMYTLQCLRDARRLLRACLEVFVREPTVDWLKAARQRSAEGSSHRSNRGWNPRERVDMVLQKLDGANPKQLLANELQFGIVAQQHEILAGYLALVNASAPVSQAKAEKAGGARNLSTELQMEMLLEMATDRKLLGIAYSGWYPWF